MAGFPGLGPDSAIGRWVARAGAGRLTPRGVRIATFSLSLAIGLGIVMVVLAAQVSSTPTFCGTCHIMKPYFESWKQSKHARIACVECHIPPGITSEIRKKYEALSMVAKYFTGTYSTNPWVEVDDAACLRCHERRLLEGKEVFHNVLFDHRPHLSESRRGLKLRCTSCHSQIVQGSHISVTSSTCALCHFKNQELNTGSGRCLNCHQIPERVMTTSGTAFDHSEVRRLDMDCRSCHAGVVRGDGAVPRERCITCHNQPDRLARFRDREFLHRMHVSEHKVNCMNCHLEIQHGKPDHPVVAAGGGCSSCHGAGHSPQRDLYAGLGGRGVPRMPGPMFAAGVTCEGCHNPSVAVTTASGAFPDRTQRANEVSCMSCHGPGYRRIYFAWKESVDSRLAALRTQLAASAPSFREAAPQAWQDARYNVELVERGKGVHNVNFAYALLERAHAQMNEARRARGLAPLALPWTTVAAGSASSQCLLCHGGIERQSGPFGNRTFPHARHLAAKLDCATCHRPHQERAPGEVVRFSASGCLPCHHRGGEVDAPRCMGCHGDVTTRTVTSFRGEFSHKGHLEQGLECATCHVVKNGDPRPAKETCGQCHPGE
jgi:nitrate/TMAO reductase-like tetraheme cytochrome c subunit